VFYTGNTYVCKKGCESVLPTDTDYWMLMTKALTLQGDTSDNTASFEMADQRQNIESGETHSILFGKIARYLNDFEDGTLVDQAFAEVYEYGTDPTAMSSSDVEDAINTEWNGETSEDETAMNSTEVEDAINKEWNGETSEDDEAISSNDIETILN
jgi:hypothetical protein